MGISEGWIKVFWDCAMGADCTHRERPGWHPDEKHMLRCRGELGLEETEVKPVPKFPSLDELRRKTEQKTTPPPKYLEIEDDDRD
jgi:hypothetical protein